MPVEWFTEPDETFGSSGKIWSFWNGSCLEPNQHKGRQIKPGHHPLYLGSQPTITLLWETLL